ncbi:MAG: P-loop NTPase fold protein [Gaiellaceae bacterium]
MGRLHLAGAPPNWTTDPSTRSIVPGQAAPASSFPAIHANRIGGSGLRRGDFAQHLAGALNRVGAFSSSTVVGLVGPWGSGKTSVINLMEQDLEENWRVSHFEPWESGDVGSLIQGFFGAISSALPDDDRGRMARSILDSRATAALPLLAVVPYAGTAARDLIQHLQERSREHRGSEQGLQQLGRALRDAGLKVLVIIDDVDRLLPDELLALFKAVRLLGRIPHVHHLLAYDERTLLDVLQQTAIVRENGRRAQDYLDKIVQVRVDLPAVQRAQASRLLDEGLRNVLDSVGVELEPSERERFGLAYQVVLSRTLTEPRPISRYLAQVEVLLSYIRPDEVNVVDFLLLTYLRVSYPGLHRRLRTEPGLLTGDDMLLTVAGRDQTYPYDWSSLLAQEGVPDVEAMHVHALLAHVFPGAAPAPKDVWLLGDFKPGLRRSGDSAYFERYFALGVAEDDVSDVTIRDALLAIGRGHASSARIDLERILSPSGEADSHLQARALTVTGQHSGSVGDSSKIV